MKNTPNRGYTYPECNPPLVQDAADLPYDLYLLAQQMNTDITTLAAAALAALNPPAAGFSGISMSPSPSGTPIVFSVTDFDNTGGVMPVINPTTVLRAPSAGLYDFTCTMLGNPSAGTIDSMQIQILVNGAVADSYTGPAFTAGTGALINAAFRLLLAAGDSASIVVVFPGGSNMTFTDAHFAGVKVVGS